MKKALILCGLLLAGSAPPAMAAGVNLNWNDCISGGLITNVSFACNANTGASTLFGSYVSPSHIDSMCANEIVLDLQSAGPLLPLWWSFQAGGCRVGSLTGEFDFTGGPFNCLDHWAGNVNISSLGYTPGFQGPSTARFVMVAAVPSANCSGPGGTGVDPGNEYYSFKLTLDRTKTTGTDSCDGCLVPVCIVLQEIKLYSPARGTTPVSINLGYPDVQNQVTWQGGAIEPPCSTPIRNRTWGALKTLYR